MEVITLSGTIRQASGKSALSQLKKEGQVPGILYGKLESNVPCAISLKELNTKVKFPIRKNQIYRLGLEGENYLVFVKDWQLDPLKTHAWKHVDFFVIDEKKKVRVSVPIEFTGKCKGLLEGGILQPLVREVEVDALPNHIPQKIEVSVADLNIGENIHVNDLTPPENTQFHAPNNYALVTVAAPADEEEKKTDGEEPEGEAGATNGEEESKS